MRYQGEVRVGWSRTELTAVREAMEVTPLFAGRSEVREIIRQRLRKGRRTDVTFDVVVAEHLAANLVALDMQTAIAKSKLLQVLQDAERHVDDQTTAVDAA
jgi:hypothetical protein